MDTHNLHLLGDSTCAIKEASYRPETGWGEEFPAFTAPGWTVHNWAVGGLSTKLMFSSGVFDKMLDVLQPDDWVCVQFGHNENKPDEERRTEPWTSFTENLRIIVQTVRERDGNVFFLSSIARRRFIDGILQHTHEDYPAAMEALSLELNVPYIDMNRVTMELLSAMGDEVSKQFFMNFPAGLYPNYPDGLTDDTHLRPEGARLIARLIYENLVKEFPGLPFLGSSATT